MDDNVALRQRVVQRAFDGVCRSVTLADRCAGRDADDDVGELLAPRLAHPQTPELDRRPRKCRTGFVLVELQIVDDQTALVNELGENSHEKYKKRQKLRVLTGSA